jgi:FKBP-type peptidyl-prolyl cis-trans isomerase (trigger factor)
MAQKDAKLGTASSADIERRLNNAYEREIEARGQLTAATALEMIIATYVTKSEIISNIERLASEFAQDATRDAIKAKKAWREHKRDEFAKQAFVSDRAAQRLNGPLAELFAVSG